MTDEQLSDSDRLNRAVGELSEERRALLLSRLGARQAERARTATIPRRPPGSDRLPCSAGQEDIVFETIRTKLAGEWCIGEFNMPIGKQDVLAVAAVVF